MEVGREIEVSRPDGRRFKARFFGDPEGFPVLTLHGTPGSRLKFSAAHGPALSRKLCLIAPDRWGYGGTSHHPQASLGAFGADMLWLADHLALGGFAVLGVSGGGPYAVATAAAAGRRAAALALFAPVGPVAVCEPANLSPLHRFCFGPLARRAWAVEAVFGGLRGLLRLSPGLGIAAAMANVSKADRHVLAVPGVAERLAATFSEGLRPGSSGPATDLRLFGGVWDVDPGKVDAPAALWIGTCDRNVPAAAAKALSSKLPNCEFKQLDGAGHLWVALNYQVLMDWIAAQVR